MAAIVTMRDGLFGCCKAKQLLWSPEEKRKRNMLNLLWFLLTSFFLVFSAPMNPPPLSAGDRLELVITTLGLNGEGSDFMTNLGNLLTVVSIHGTKLRSK